MEYKTNRLTYTCLEKSIIIYILFPTFIDNTESCIFSGNIICARKKIAVNQALVNQRKVDIDTPCFQVS